MNTVCKDKDWLQFNFSPKQLLVPTEKIQLLSSWWHLYCHKYKYNLTSNTNTNWSKVQIRQQTTVQDNQCQQRNCSFSIFVTELNCAQIQKSTQIQIEMPTQIQMQYLTQIQMQHITNLTQLRICNRCTGCTGQVIDLQWDFHQPQTAAAAAANTRWTIWVIELQLDSHQIQPNNTAVAILILLLLLLLLEFATRYSRTNLQRHWEHGIRK